MEIDFFKSKKTWTMYEELKDLEHVRRKFWA